MLARGSAGSRRRGSMAPSICRTRSRSDRRRIVPGMIIPAMIVTGIKAHALSSSP
jgi:hypothetical protein